MIEFLYIDRATNGFVITIKDEEHNSKQFIAHTWHDIIERIKEEAKKEL